MTYSIREFDLCRAIVQLNMCAGTPMERYDDDGNQNIGHFFMKDDDGVYKLSRVTSEGEADATLGYYSITEFHTFIQAYLRGYTEAMSDAAKALDGME